MAHLSLSLLGPYRATLDGKPITGFAYVKVRALLAYLMIEADHPQPRGKLAGLLWPDRPERVARGNLRNALSNLRYVIDDRQARLPHLLVTRETIQFNQDSDHWLDVASFQRLLDEARASHPAEAPSTSREDQEQLTDDPRAACWEEAMALYQGPFLDDLVLRDGADFEAWALAMRTALEREALAALRQLAQHHGERGDYERARAVAWRETELAPWREGAHRRLMQWLALSGQRSAALAQYQACCRILMDELGVRPAARTTALYEAIRDGTLSPGSLLTFEPHLAAGGTAAREPVARAGEKAPAFVARERELARLSEYLALVLEGHGRTVFVTGEAGQGKTALIRAFARRAQDVYPDLIVAGGNCNAYTGVGDPYLPFREILELLTGDIEARWAAGATASEYARRLWRALPAAAQALLAAGPDLVDTFLPGAALLRRAEAHAPTALRWLDPLRALVERQAARSAASSLPQDDLFQQYAAVLRALARRMPLLLIVDDLQWADLGSISLLFHLGRRLEGSRVLIVGAYRTEEVAQGRHGERHPLAPVVSEIKREWGDVEISLDRAAGRSFTERLLDQEPNLLGSAFRETLHQQTRGHPLFTLELLRGMQGRGDLVRNEAGRWVEGAALDWDTLPARVEAVIAERIGRLAAPLRAMLRVACIEGETFTAEVVAQVQGLETREARARLSDELDRQHRLVHAQGTLYIDGERTSRYGFRHILFQKYLYSSLDPVERAQLHDRVGTALEARYEGQAGTAPQLAWHFEEAGIPTKAIAYLQQAGERAVRLSAHAEAVVHVRKALTLLETIAPTAERAQRELALQLDLAVPLQALEGYSSPEAGRVLGRARELCREVRESSQIFPTLSWLNTYYGLRGEYGVALELGEEMLERAQRAEDPLLVAIAHAFIGYIHYQRGEFRQGRTHCARTAAFYDPQQHRHLVYAYGVHPCLYALAWLGCSLWFLGYPEQARQWSEKTLDIAQELDHPFTLAFALSVSGAQFHIYCREFQAARAWAVKEIGVAEEGQFLFYQAMGRIHLGCALAGLEQTEEGIAQIQRGLEIVRASDSKAYLTSFLAGLAEAYIGAGQVEEAAAALEEAFALIEEIGERFYEAELYRLKGKLWVLQGGEQQAERCYERAIAVARQQGARSWELRAATSLARLWQKQQRRDEARRLMHSTYGWFSEGFEAPDLREAKRLLEALR
jgi:DNA-binding SARP family transcriptional activator/predicted ATPase